MGKTDNPLVSIIIPVYKVEKYLDTCLNSVAKQTYSNLEVMLIDDGSPDNSGIICDKYAEADVRFHVIHKQNAGTSSARNTGILASHGSLVSFVDPDDYVDTDFYEKLYIKSTTTNSDIIKGNVISINMNTKDSYIDKKMSNIEKHISNFSHITLKS